MAISHPFLISSSRFPVTKQPATEAPHAANALAPKIAMNQAAWLNVAICAAQRAKIAIQEAKSLKTEDPRRRLLINREIDEFSTVNMAFNRAAGTRVLLDSVTFRWMFDYSQLDQSVIEEAP
jgi:hypothetical protein